MRTNELTYDQLIPAAQEVLRRNDAGEWTTPSQDLYVHEWFWDSAKIAIGLATFDPERAKTELLSMRRGQWTNGMMPHIIFGNSPDYWEGPDFWRSKDVPGSPTEYDTSAITQPPVVTFATKIVADALPDTDRKIFLNDMYPTLLRYHQWMYRERASESGLFVAVTPWETGLDNAPPWMYLINKVRGPLLPTVAERMGLGRLIQRGDTKHVPLEERQTNMETLKLAALALQYRKWGYDSATILERSKVVVESLDFNCILVRANEALQQIADDLNEPLPLELQKNMQKTTEAIEDLWDDSRQEYFSRDYRTGRLMTESSVVTFLPLFAGTASPERAQILVNKLDDPLTYGAEYPVPSAPMNSKYFSDRCYWQGPSWFNEDWFIINGLWRYNFNQKAGHIGSKAIEMVLKSGFREYYSPRTGEGFGARNFSWTAALLLDLLVNQDYTE